jgi:hypothetical protein
MKRPAGPVRSGSATAPRHTETLTRCALETTSRLVATWHPAGAPDLRFPKDRLNPVLFLRRKRVELAPLRTEHPVELGLFRTNAGVSVSQLADDIAKRKQVPNVENLCLRQFGDSPLRVDQPKDRSPCSHAEAGLCIAHRHATPCSWSACLCTSGRPRLRGQAISPLQCY